MVKNKNSDTKNSYLRKYWPVATLLALVLIGVCSYLLFVNNHAASSGTIPAKTSNNQTITKTKSSGTTTAQTVNSKTGTSDPTTDASANLTAPPTGSFVSNHRPSLSGSTKPSGEQSTCNTVPGATCYIKFTNGDIVKKLPSQVADDNGDVIWNWDVAEAGLSEGSWKITAVAQADGKSFEATDNMNLEVQP